jgi:RIO kinase 1
MATTLPEAHEASSTDTKTYGASHGKVAAPVVVRRSPWSLPTATTTSQDGNGSVKPKTFAEIMAEQNQDKQAAQAAYDAFAGPEKTLAELQLEQERLFSSFQTCVSAATTATEETTAAEHGLSPEELRMIEQAMQDSLQLQGTPKMDSTSLVSGTSSAATISFAKEQMEERVKELIEQPAPAVVDSPHSAAATAAIVLTPVATATKERHDVEHAFGSADHYGGGKAPEISAATTDVVGAGLSAEAAAAIEAALREADAKAEAESLRLALQFQQEEIYAVRKRHDQYRMMYRQGKGNIRTMTRAELQAEADRLHEGLLDPNMPVTGGLHYDADEDADDDMQAAGFRMNPSGVNQQWSRRDRNTIVGPDGDLRTKHDLRAQSQANAHSLGLDRDVHVGNAAFNAFRKTMKRTTKGVATHGTGRAGTDTDATKGKAMDSQVRLIISRAINNELIERCNGAVKQGKEAIVYHADRGRGGACEGFDVAVKVFKKIKEFRSRGEYVDGDPRFAGRPYRSLTDREQLEIWTEKEYRNLVRAHRAKVPTPTPLDYKQNVLFMRFMGNDGWPAPQIREIELRKGSKIWDVLYTQVMESIRRLYVGARLVHGDLSEYNILIAPVFQVDHPIDAEEGDLQTVLIDFGQSVDTRHPDAQELLGRDLLRVKQFFFKQGVPVMSDEEATKFVVGGDLPSKEKSLEKIDESAPPEPVNLLTNEN